MSNTVQHHEQFDEVAEEYDAALQKGLSVTGEDKRYFARGRIQFLKRLLPPQALSVRSILDFGCGTGSATPNLIEAFSPRQIVGVDVSPKSILVANREHGSSVASFSTIADARPAGTFDLAFVNGVFHHIPPAQRADSFRWVFDSLKPGGYFAFWENNPWNPATRWVMSRCEFDADAIVISPIEARRMLRAAGFSVQSSRHLFIFPRILKFLRFSERPLSPLPIGGQYQILCRKPE